MYVLDEKCRIFCPLCGTMLDPLEPFEPIEPSDSIFIFIEIPGDTLFQCRDCKETFKAIEGTTRKRLQEVISFCSSFSFQALRISRNKRQALTF